MADAAEVLDPGQGTPNPDETVTLEGLHGDATKAFDAYEADPTDVTKEAFKGALGKVGEYKHPEPKLPEPPKLPDKYDLTIPKDSLLDPSIVDEISAYAKEKGLSNEAAQGLLERESKAVSSFRESQDSEVKEIRDSWLGEAENDKEIGGDDFKKNAELAKRVIDRFSTVEFKKTLNETGFGNHPEVIRIFTRIGKLMGEDVLARSGVQGSGEKSMEDVLYGKPEEK